MNDNDSILAYFLPPPGEEIALKNDRAAMGNDVRDYIYEQVYPYPEVMWVLVAGLFAWAHDVEHAGAHERNWPRRVSRIEAMQIVIKCIERCMEEDTRLGQLN